MQLLTRLPSHRRLLREASTSSLSSCFTVDQGKSALVASPSACKRNHRVHFNQDANEVYFNCEDLQVEEIAAAWYSDQEIDRLRDANQEYAQQLVSMASDSRRRKIQRAYQSFCGTTTRHNQKNGEVDLILKSCRYVVADLHITGMEKCMLLPREREWRRSKLQQQVQYWTTTIDVRESDRDCQLRVACEQTSRPCRLFAFYVAMCTAVAACQSDNEGI